MLRGFAEAAAVVDLASGSLEWSSHGRFRQTPAGKVKSRVCATWRHHHTRSSYVSDRERIDGALGTFSSLNMHGEKQHSTCDRERYQPEGPKRDLFVPASHLLFRDIARFQHFIHRCRRWYQFSRNVHRRSVGPRTSKKLASMLRTLVCCVEIKGQWRQRDRARCGVFGVSRNGFNPP